MVQGRNGASLALGPLQRQPVLARDFKIPDDMASGQVQGQSKVFTQTIRAQRADVAGDPDHETWWERQFEHTREVAAFHGGPLTIQTGS